MEYTPLQHQARKLLIVNDFGGYGARNNVELIDAVGREIEKLQPKCPQACGRDWPACGCPTAELKDIMARRADLGKRVRVYRQGESTVEMMDRLGRAPLKI